MASPGNHHCKGSDRGFTLLEVLVVLAIIGLLATLAPAALGRAADAARARAALEALEQGLMTARLRAVASRSTTSLQVDPMVGRWWVEPRGPQGTLPPGPIVLDVADDGRAADGSTGGRAMAAGAVFFFPDGGSSGFRLELTGSGSGLRLTVDWLTGRVEVGG